MFPVLKLTFTYVLFVLNKNKHKYPVKGTQTYTSLLNITHVSAEDRAPNPCNMWTLNYLMSGKTEQVSPHGQVLTFSGEGKIDFCGYFSSLFFLKPLHEQILVQFWVPHPCSQQNPKNCRTPQVHITRAAEKPHKYEQTSLPPALMEESICTPAQTRTWGTKSEGL